MVFMVSRYKPLDKEEAKGIGNSQRYQLLITGASLIDQAR